jgi:hydrogenase maturation protein HypF
MACSWLVAAGDEDPPLLPGVEPARWRAVAQMARTGTAAPPTTSAGRLFDAVAALCGIRGVVTYEGQAAAELEAACDPRHRDTYDVPVTPALTLDARPLIRSIVEDVAGGVDVSVVSARFHNGLAAATAAAVTRIASERDLGAAVLSGGVFQNRVLLEGVADRLERAGLRVLIPLRLPPNDGGISYGQAAVAAARGM